MSCETKRSACGAEIQPHPDGAPWETCYSLSHPDGPRGGMSVNSGKLFFRWAVADQPPGPWLEWGGASARLVHALRLMVPPEQGGEP